MVGYGALFLAASRRLWTVARFWGALAIGAGTSIAVVLPFFLPYLSMQREEGFRRSLADAGRYSAPAASYLVSPAHAHQWLIPIARSVGWHGEEVLFPGLLALALGAGGFAIAMRMRRARHVSAAGDGETALLYGSLGVFSAWASLGPPAGLYTAMFHTIPLFTFLRAPSRFGLIVTFALSILAAFAVRRLLEMGRRAPTVVAAVLGLGALLELNALPFPWERALTVSPAYGLLARLPRAPVAEFPFYGERVAFPLHAQYMVLSTSHWMPLVNGYSDHIPQDFREAAAVLDSFPSNDSFAVLQRRRVRYIGVHWAMYGGRAGEIRARLEPFSRHLRQLASDGDMTLFEIVSFP